MARTKELQADILVCGAGAAGLSAALTARYGNASVAVFEKRAVTGGTTIFTEGLFAVESPLQIRRMIGITKDEMFRKHMDYSHWRANARLLRAFIDKSGETIQWLQHQGVEFEGPTAIYPRGPHVWHMTRGGALVKALVAKARDNGIQIYLNTPAKRLLMDDENRIVGVMAEDKEGNTIRANAKAVIISSGDFASNKEMMEQYTSVEEAVPFFDLNMTGDGIQMAWDVGAAPEGTNVTLGGMGVPGEKPGSHLWAVICQPLLWINLRGERYTAEDITFHFPFALNAQVNQPNKVSYVLFDEKTKRSMMEEGIWAGLGEVIPVTTKLVKLDKDLQRGVKQGKAFIADTPEELAEKIGVDPRVLKENIDEYNHYCDKNHDELFAKDPRYLRPVRMAKFYGIKSQVFIMATLGGIKINEKTEVQNKRCEVIPGLYAAGNCAGGIYGDSYDVSNTTGGALSFAINSGRIAGENALKYISQ